MTLLLFISRHLIMQSINSLLNLLPLLTFLRTLTVR